MKHLLFALVLVGYQAVAQNGQKRVPSMLATTETGGRLPTKITLGAGISLLNSYQIGNPNQFYQYISDNTSLVLDDGTSGMKYLSLGMLTAPTGKAVIGMEVQYQMTHPSHAIWGEDTDYGFATRMRFGGKFFNFTFKAGAPMGEQSYFMIEPSLILGTMNGLIGIYNSLNNYVQEWEENTAYGLGGQLTLGPDLMLGKVFGISLRGGYRYLKIEETHADSGSTTGFKSFYANGSDGETVHVDWSGLFVNVGLLLKFGKDPDE